MSEPDAIFLRARKKFHKTLLETILTINKDGVASNSDKENRPSVEIAKYIANKIGYDPSKTSERGAGQTSGKKFESICAEFIRDTFLRLENLRPGKWDVHQVSGRNRLEIAKYDQYSHLVALDAASKQNSELAAALGSDYTIIPDVIISREPEEDEEINRLNFLVDDNEAKHSSLRKTFNKRPILHASVSCKWSIRSDRAQNSRSEGLNLVRNRKGHLPHVVVVTAEPTPSRLASIALGTGDIDCVYHFALYELIESLNNLDYPDAKDMLDIMVSGNRLKDISDLPLDLAV